MRAMTMVAVVLVGAVTAVAGWTLVCVEPVDEGPNAKEGPCWRVYYRVDGEAAVRAVCGHSPEPSLAWMCAAVDAQVKKTPMLVPRAAQPPSLPKPPNGGKTDSHDAPGSTIGDSVDPRADRSPAPQPAPTLPFTAPLAGLGCGIWLVALAVPLGALLGTIWLIGYAARQFGKP